MTDVAAPPRLSYARLMSSFPYDRTSVTPGIVHLGTGAFHRAHMAVYVDNLLASDPSWGIVGASLRKADTREALAPQDFLYTLAILANGTSAHRVIGSLVEVLDATTQRAALFAALSDPRIRIVSLTVTEKGYCHDPATGVLDARHPDIMHDVAHPEAPISAPGIIVRALELRRQRGIAPFAVLSCDNLPANGQTTRRVVAGFAALRNGALAAHVEGGVAFPSTMVDRIVPATTDEDRKSVLAATGMWDAWPVVTEPFTQWVIEDNFPLGRPAFAAAGAQLVGNVEPFELMKLRMLNGSHSTIAYLGYLAGYEYVNEAISDPAFRTLIHDLMTREVMETLPKELGDLSAYRDALLDRFANPALKHRTWQIAMDGSQKLPQRLLSTIRDRLGRGRSIAQLALGVAGWMRYVMATDEQGRKIDVRDPLAGRLRAIVATAGRAPQDIVDGLLGVDETFSEDLVRDDAFRTVVTAHLSSLLALGARATVRNMARNA